MRIFPAIATFLLLTACGGGSGDAPAAQEGGSAQPVPATAGNDSSGPDTSDLGEIVLGKINADPSRQEMKATATMQEFKIVSVNTESLGDAASSIVECAGTVVFDADAYWGMEGIKKAGEPAKFECRAEYVKQGGGWQVFGPMGIYPL